MCLSESISSVFESGSSVGFTHRMGAKQGDLLKAIGDISSLRLAFEVEKACCCHVGRLPRQHSGQTKGPPCGEHHLHPHSRLVMRLFLYHTYKSTHKKYCLLHNSVR